MMLPRGTRPQTRESQECARLSPSIRYMPFGMRLSFPTRRNCEQRLRIGVAAAGGDVGLDEPVAVDVGHAFALGPGLSGEADDALHEDPADALARRLGWRMEHDDVASLRIVEVVDEAVREDAVRARGLAIRFGPCAVQRGLHRRRGDPVRVDHPRFDTDHDRDCTHDREDPVHDHALSVREPREEPFDGAAQRCATRRPARARGRSSRPCRGRRAPDAGA